MAIYAIINGWVQHIVAKNAEKSNGQKCGEEVCVTTKPEKKLGGVEIYTIP